MMKDNRLNRSVFVVIALAWLLFFIAVGAAAYVWPWS